MTATDTSPVSVASYFVNMYFVGCLQIKSVSIEIVKLKETRFKPLSKAK